MVPTRSRPLLAPLVAGIAAIALAGCAPAAVGAPPAATRPAVGGYSSSNPGSVNTLWIDGPQGLVVVDTQRSLTDARRAVAEIQETGRPVAAILVTHAHPDHVGGIGVLRAAFPDAPVHASEATATTVRSDRFGQYALTRQLPDADYAPEMTVPDAVFAPGGVLEVGGLRIETAEFGPGEHAAATVFHEPASGALFVGDLVSNAASPALLEGSTCGWLTDLDRLQARFPGARTLHPGHGASGPAAELISAQREYLQRFRALVRAATRPDSAAGATVDAAEHAHVVAETARRYPGYPSVASLPTMMDENVKAVAEEIRTEDPARLPASCRDA